MADDMVVVEKGKLKMAIEIIVSNFGEYDVVWLSTYNVLFWNLFGRIAYGTQGLLFKRRSMPFIR